MFTTNFLSKDMLRHVSHAIINLYTAKLRSSLAILGILVGTAAIVALINCGQLATDLALAQFKTLGTDLMAISSFQQNENQDNPANATLSLKTWLAIPEHIPSIKYIAPYSTAYLRISSGGHNLSAVLVGVTTTLTTVNHIHLAAGKFISSLHTFEAECVIGSDIAHQLQSHTLQNPIGQQILIGQRLYTIIGVTAPWKPNAFFNSDINQAVMIPLVGMAALNKSASINNAMLVLKQHTAIAQVITQIKNFLKLQAPTQQLFIRSSQQIISSMENQGHIFTLLLGVIGGIALLVGGIGIMNVMLVSVSERTKEIGIRKAIGATKKDIQVLFLTEAIILSGIGGICGIILGILVTWVAAYISHWHFHIYILPLCIGFIVSVASGIFFGFYPATRAAKLQPIACLRQE